MKTIVFLLLLFGSFQGFSQERAIHVLVDDDEAFSFHRDHATADGYDCVIAIKNKVSKDIDYYKFRVILDDITKEFKDNGVEIKMPQVLLKVSTLQSLEHCQVHDLLSSKIVTLVFKDGNKFFLYNSMYLGTVRNVVTSYQRGM